MQDSQAQTSEDWLKLAEREFHCGNQLYNLQDPMTYNATCGHIALSTEHLMKSLIIKRKRLNCWPAITAENRNSHYTHNLSRLLQTAELQEQYENSTIEIQAAFNILRQYNISERYNLDHINKKDVEDMIKSYAIFRDWADNI